MLKALASWSWFPHPSFSARYGDFGSCQPSAEIRKAFGKGKETVALVTCQNGKLPRVCQHRTVLHHGGAMSAPAVQAGSRVYYVKDANNRKGDSNLTPLPLLEALPAAAWDELLCLDHSMLR